jgi:hypothetical protein
VPKVRTGTLGSRLAKLHKRGLRPPEISPADSRAERFHLSLSIRVTRLESRN